MDFPMDDFQAASPSQSLTSIPPSFSQIPTRHPSMSFADGTICLLDVNRTYYFNVHRGLLSRHSEPLRQAINVLVDKSNGIAKERLWLIEGSLVLEMDDDQGDLAKFLSALYDGVSNLKYDTTDFPSVSSILRLATKYRVEHIRCDVLRGLSIVWPKTLQGWEFREADATDSQGNYKPRMCYPHPILIINLARQTNSPCLLPSAFYDLSRCSALEIASGYLSSDSTGLTMHHTLSEVDLLRALRGREYASRYLSKFVVNNLEGYLPSAHCLHLASQPGGDPNTSNPSRRTICQVTFEATTFEVLRDVNGVVFHRSSDPLFTMMDADLMQTGQRSPGTSSPGSNAGGVNGQAASGRLGSLYRACEACRLEFTSVVDAAREEMWHRLPGWFGVEVPDWP